MNPTIWAVRLAWHLVWGPTFWVVLVFTIAGLDTFHELRWKWRHRK